jgi:hypothetical protein
MSRKKNPGRRRFNSATAMRPWDTPPYKQQLKGGKKLQFGHGDEAVGYRNPQAGHRIRRLASIRPRR